MTISQWHVPEGKYLPLITRFHEYEVKLTSCVDSFISNLPD